MLAKDGTRRTLDNPEAITYFFRAVTDTHPPAPSIPAPSAEVVASAAAVRAREKVKATGQALTGRINAEGKMEIIGPSGEIFTLDSA